MLSACHEPGTRPYPVSYIYYLILWSTHPMKYRVVLRMAVHSWVRVKQSMKSSCCATPQTLSIRTFEGPSPIHNGLLWGLDRAIPGFIGETSEVQGKTQIHVFL